MSHAIERHDATIGGLNIHYRTCGTGHPVLLVHGWPTSSHLWRDVMPKIAAAGARAVAIDLPGFGGSDKPVDGSYSFPFFARAIDGLVDQLGSDTIDLVVHDLGGPVGLFWAASNPARVRRLGLLNTIVYPELSWAVILFMLVNRVPGVRDVFTGPRGLAWAMQLGVARRLSPDEIDAYVAPFETAGARRALQKAAGGNLHRDGMTKIEAYIKQLSIPVRVIYGDRDPILPEVAATMRRVKRDVPHAEVTVLEGARHFIHEDRPEDLGRMLAEFVRGGG